MKNFGQMLYIHIFANDDLQCQFKQHTRVHNSPCPFSGGAQSFVFALSQLTGLTECCNIFSNYFVSQIYHLDTRAFVFLNF